MTGIFLFWFGMKTSEDLARNCAVYPPARGGRWCFSSILPACVPVYPCARFLPSVLLSKNNRFLFFFLRKRSEQFCSQCCPATACSQIPAAAPEGSPLPTTQPPTSPGAGGHLPGGWRPPARVLSVGLHSLDTSALIVSHPCVHRLTDCRSDVSLQGLSLQRRDPRVQRAGCCTRLWGGIPGSGTQAGPGGGPRSSRGAAPCGLPCPAPLTCHVFSVHSPHGITPILLSRG